MPEGFDAVYRSYGRPVYAYLARLTGNPSTAEELCQETFVRYLKHRDDLRCGNGAVGTWLYRVATNLAIDRGRRRTAGPLREEPAVEDRDAVEARDLDDRVRAEVARLPAELRAVFLLRAHHELTYARIALVLDISERTAKERFRRAREILAHRLAPLFSERQT